MSIVNCAVPFVFARLSLRGTRLPISLNCFGSLSLHVGRHRHRRRFLRERAERRLAAALVRDRRRCATRISLAGTRHSSAAAATSIARAVAPALRNCSYELRDRGAAAGALRRSPEEIVVELRRRPARLRRAPAPSPRRALRRPASRGRCTCPAPSRGAWRSPSRCCRRRCARTRWARARRRGLRRCACDRLARARHLRERLRQIERRA